MASFWTVVPNQVERKELQFRGRDFWIDLKQELTTGERARIEAAAFRSYSRRGGQDVDKTASDDVAMDMEMNVNFELSKFEKMRVWLAAWSLCDDNNQPLPLTVETLRALKDGLGELIEKAVDDHAKEVRDAAKKPEASGQSTPASHAFGKTSS